jgi:hypothetical protein
VNLSGQGSGKMAKVALVSINGLRCKQLTGFEEVPKLH